MIYPVDSVIRLLNNRGQKVSIFFWLRSWLRRLRTSETNHNAHSQALRVQISTDGIIFTVGSSAYDQGAGSGLRNRFSDYDSDTSEKPLQIWATP